MSLSAHHLDAFASVAREKSFSAAAKKLHITQSALSQRILNLEQEIGSSLFIREPSGVRLTELGQRLLRYCRSKEMLEMEFLANLGSDKSTALSGIVKVAGFSTITRSVLIPVLSQLVSDHPLLQLAVRSEELRNLPPLLFSGGADFVFGLQPIQKQGLENHALGFEENVLIQTSAKTVSPDVYLDHDEEDATTFDFFRAQGRKVPSFRRSYLGDIDSIVDAVRLGVGRAVVPLHLVKSMKGVKVVEGYKSLKTPVYLTYYSQAFYTQLQSTVIDLLCKQVPKYL
jgi:DNA-binding transcriptional LysR family regulator